MSHYRCRRRLWFSNSCLVVRLERTVFFNRTWEAFLYRGYGHTVLIKQAPKVPCSSGCAVCASLLVMDDELVCALCKGAENAVNNITLQKLVVNNKCGHRL